jgi:3-hydroxymyristoyl/3-hydroxydecanoyl-(acyl carrier protein) dehydratase
MHVIQIGGSPGGGEARVRFDARDPVFKGHFPQTPILPGVVLIDTAVELVARVLERPLQLERLASVKFCSVVAPDEAITFTFTAVPEAGDAGRVKVNGRWFRETGKIAELVFTATPPAVERDRS